MNAFNKLITSMEDTKEIDQAIEVMEAEDSSDPEDIEKVEDYKEELEKIKQQKQQKEGTDSVEEGATEEGNDTESTGEGEATDEGTGEESPEATEGSEEPTEESSEESKETKGEQDGKMQENQEGYKEGNREKEVTSTESLSLTKEEIMIKEGEENLEPIYDLKEKLEEAKECDSMESITAFDFRKARKAIEKLGFSIENLNMVALSNESEKYAENLDAAITNLNDIATKVQHGIKMAKDKLTDSKTK